MSNLNEKSATLPEFHSGSMIYGANAVRLDLSPAKGELGIVILKRQPWPGFALSYPVSVKDCAVPALGGVVLMYADANGMLDRLIAHLPLDTRASLARAIEDADAADYHATQADALHDMAQDGGR